jgi:hypothetical protein
MPGVHGSTPFLEFGATNWTAQHHSLNMPHQTC